MKKLLLSAIVLFSFVRPGYACTTCNAQVREAIFDSAFYPNLLVMLSAFLVLTAFVVLFIFVGNHRYKHHLIQASKPTNNSVPAVAAALILGIGLGGFIDGIVLHQILQWHEMLSGKISTATVVGKSVNMFWDGIFHLFCLLVVFVGIAQFWRAMRRSDTIVTGKVIIGGMLCGWGLFNLVEGIIDHHLLELHNVKELDAHQSLYNLAFLGFSFLLLFIGYLLIRSKPHMAVVS